MADSDRSRFDYEPINSAPGLFSIYGCGLSLYGSRDKDPDTSSHVATRFITLVYFPLFAIGAFRIAKTAQGSFYLGKTTLSSVTRVWNYVVFAALLALFGTGYWQSHITSPEYIAEKRMEKVEVALSDQRIGDAAELLSKVFSSRTSFAIGAGEKLHLLVDNRKVSKHGP